MTDLLSSAIRNTILESQTLAPILACEYELPEPVECELIRRGFNDHYRVAAGDARYVLRIYLAGKYYIESADDFRFELDLLTFLAERGVSVAHPVPRRDGALLGSMETPGGERHYALFSVAEGERSATVTPEQARALGETVGALHIAANEFRSPYRRHRLDLEYLLERPLREIEALLGRCGRGDLTPYRSSLEHLAERVRRLPLDGDAFGIIHGDLHLGNIHFDAEDRPTLFDFDHGGFGWRAYDLSACRDGMSEVGWEAFLAAYRRIRPVTPAELALLPVFQAIGEIWDIGDVLAMRVAWGEVPTEGEDSDENMADDVVRVLSELSHPV